MIEKIDLKLATFKTEQEVNQAREDIIKGIDSNFWKWIVRVLKKNEEVMANQIIEGDFEDNPKMEARAKAFVTISKMIRGLPKEQLEELNASLPSEEQQEDFFGDEDPYDKGKKGA